MDGGQGEETHMEKRAAKFIRHNHQSSESLIRFIVLFSASSPPRQMYGPSSVHITASTGLAASNLSAIAADTNATSYGHGDGLCEVGNGACTLHSFAGVGLAYADRYSLVEQVKKNQAAVRRWKGAKALVIDEISMVGPGLFVSTAFRSTKEHSMVQHSVVQHSTLSTAYCRMVPPTGSIG